MSEILVCPLCRLSCNRFEMVKEMDCGQEILICKACKKKLDKSDQDAMKFMNAWRKSKSGDIKSVK